MSLHALVLVLFAAVCHAVWNLSAKRVFGDGPLFVFLYSVGSLAIWGPITAVWFALHHPAMGWAWVVGAAVSGALHVGYGIVLQHGYRVGDLTLVYPTARGVGPLVTLVVAIALLGERPPVWSVVGACVVLLGIAVITVPRSLSLHGTRQREGLRWGAGTGLTIAAYTLWDSHAVNALRLPPLPYFTLSLAFQVLALAPRAWVRRPELPSLAQRNWRPALTIALLSPLAYVLVLEAMRLAPVALVAAARETSIVIGALLGYLLLREPNPARRFVGAVVVLLGIGLLVLG
ncbi:MAG: EamA family transporter [Nocardioidaceae bacterium]